MSRPLTKEEWRAGLTPETRVSGCACVLAALVALVMVAVIALACAA